MLGATAIIYMYSAVSIAPPPGSDVRITDNSEERITDAGDRRITD